MELTIDASERLSVFFIVVPSVRMMASFPDIISNRTTPNAYTSLFDEANPSLKYLRKK